jgi:hypothetical protein
LISLDSHEMWLLPCYSRNFEKFIFFFKPVYELFLEKISVEHRESCVTVRLRCLEGCDLWLLKLLILLCTFLWAKLFLWNFDRIYINENLVTKVCDFSVSEFSILYRIFHWPAFSCYVMCLIMCFQILQWKCFTLTCQVIFSMTSAVYWTIPPH